MPCRGPGSALQEWSHHIQGDLRHPNVPCPTHKSLLPHSMLVMGCFPPPLVQPRDMDGDTPGIPVFVIPVPGMLQDELSWEFSKGMKWCS